MKGCAAVLALAAVLAAAVAGAARAAKPSPPPSLSSVEVWGQPSSADETAGRPLGQTLALFSSAAHAASLPASQPGTIGLSLPWVAGRMKGDPGKLVVAKTRRVATPAGPVYLVPTQHGWLCMQGATFATCHRGLLRGGVTWGFWSTPTGIDVIGVAADDVSRIVLTGGGRRWTARLHDNVFFVSRPIAIADARHLPPLGTLVVSYRGGAHPARVPLR